ncbi:MAG: extracellular solute-binding protein [Spirochaetes bacterium]|nr:extracellular solute-binding protein [Spirochaetota bacterium]
MKKIVLLFIAFLIVYEVNAAGKKVLMWSFAANNIAEWQERKADIEKKFNIELVIEQVAEQAFVQKLQAVMMDGKGVPDIIEWKIEQNQILNADPKKCFVYPLDKYVSKSNVFKNVVAGRVSWVKYGKSIYGLPHDVHPVVLIYNDTLWKSVGVDLAKIETWDDFFTAAQKLSVEKKDGKPLHYALPWSATMNDTMFMIWQQTGAQILDKTGKPTLNTPQFKEFVTKWIEWYKTGTVCAWDWGNFAALLKNGTLAAYASPDWWVPQVNEAASSGQYQFKVKSLPYYKKGGPQTASWGGTFLAIPKTAKNPDQIYKIMEYMQYDSSAIKVRYQKTEMLPPFASVWDDPLFKKEDKRFGGQKLGELQTTLAKKMPDVITGDLFWDVIFRDFGPNLSEIVSGKMTIEQALKVSQAAAEKRYKDAAKK